MLNARHTPSRLGGFPPALPRSVVCPMPQPVSPTTLDDLIQQNITDELQNQNTAERLREVLLTIRASMVNKADASRLALPLTPAAALALATAAAPAAKLVPGTLYILTPRLAAQGQPLPDVRIRAASETQLEPQGLLMQAGGPVLVGYDLATDKTSVAVDAYTKAQSDARRNDLLDEISLRQFGIVNSVNYFTGTPVLLPVDYLNFFVQYSHPQRDNLTLPTFGQFDENWYGAAVLIQNQTTAPLKIYNSTNITNGGQPYLLATLAPLEFAYFLAAPRKAVGNITGGIGWAVAGRSAAPATPGNGNSGTAQKLYTSLGQNTDGSLDQKTATDALNARVKTVNGAAPDAAGNVSTAGVFHGAWAANTDYAQNDEVLQAGVRYYALAAFRSGSAYDATKWGKSSGLLNLPDYRNEVIMQPGDTARLPGLSYVLPSGSEVQVPSQQTGSVVGYLLAFRNLVTATQPATISVSGGTIAGAGSLVLQPGEYAWLRVTGPSAYEIVLRGFAQEAPADPGTTEPATVRYTSAQVLDASAYGKRHAFAGTGVALSVSTLPPYAGHEGRTLTLIIDKSAEGMWRFSGGDYDDRFWKEETVVLQATASGFRRIGGNKVPLFADIGLLPNGPQTMLALTANSLKELPLPKTFVDNSPGMLVNGRLKILRAGYYVPQLSGRADAQQGSYLQAFALVNGTQNAENVAFSNVVSVGSTNSLSLPAVARYYAVNDIVSLGYYVTASDARLWDATDYLYFSVHFSLTEQPS